MSPPLSDPPLSFRLLFIFIVARKAVRINIENSQGGANKCVRLSSTVRLSQNDFQGLEENSARNDRKKEAGLELAVFFWHRVTHSPCDERARRFLFRPASLEKRSIPKKS